jgi:hypothetical protein
MGAHEDRLRAGRHTMSPEIDFASPRAPVLAHRAPELAHRVPVSIVTMTGSRTSA